MATLQSDMDSEIQTEGNTRNMEITVQTDATDGSSSISHDAVGAKHIENGHMYTQLEANMADKNTTESGKTSHDCTV